MKRKNRLGVFEIMNALVCSAVTVVERQGDGGGGHRLDAAATDRIRQRQQAASPSGDGGDGGDTSTQSAPAPGSAGAPTPAASATPAPSSPAVPAAQPPAIPATPPAAPGALGGASNGQSIETAIALERSTRDLKLAQQEARQATAELQRVRESGRDPMALLAAHGHKIEDVVQTWLGPDDGAGGAPAGGQPPAAPAQRGQQPAEDQRIAQLQQQVQQLTNFIATGQQQVQRGGRLDSIKQLISGSGDALGLIAALGLEDQALAAIEQLEQQQGGQLGQVELMQRLYDHEKGARGNVQRQLGQLMGLPWAQEIMWGSLAKLPDAEQAFRKALESAAGARPAPAPSLAPATQLGPREHTPPAATQSGNAETAVVQTGGLQSLNPSHQELKQRGRAKIAAFLQRKHDGLG